MTELLLVRHGETDWNAQHRWQGRDDPPLNATGIAQAHELAATLADQSLDALYSSDLRRALMTAEILAERFDLAVRPLTELREIDVGNWSGLTSAQLEERFPDQFARHLESWGSGWTDGERPEQLTKRVVTAARRIAEEHPAGRLLVVAHGGVIRALTAVALAVPFADFTRGHVVIGNCSVARFVCENGSLRALD